MEATDTTSSASLAAAKASKLTTNLFRSSLKNFVDYNKPDPIARRQLESWDIKWSESDGFRDGVAAKVCGDEKEPIQWNPKHYIGGVLEIRGDFVSVMFEIGCIWADGDAAKNDNTVEDGRLSFTCRLKSGKLIEKKLNEEKRERKIRKKMMSRLREDTYIAQLLGLGKENESSTELFLAKASIYVNATKFELEERVDVSQNAAEILRRSLWSSTSSSLDIVEVMLSLPSLPCRSADKVEATTRLANRAKLRLLEDAMLDECEKEGEGELIEDLTISNPKGSSQNELKQQVNIDVPARKNKKIAKR